MFNYILRKKNKQPNKPKVSYEKYIVTASEIEYHIPAGLTEKQVDDDMGDSLADMRRRFKRSRDRLRGIDPDSA